VRRTWEATKAQERSERAKRRAAPGDPFSGVPNALPALMRAAKLQSRIRGFEGEESPEALDSDWVRRLQDLPDGSPSRAAEELGDALFATVALARALGVDPEAALRDANARFEASARESDERSV